MRKGIFISILSALLFASCSNLHFGEGTSVSLYLPALEGSTAARNISRAIEFPAGYDGSVYYYEVNLKQDGNTKFTKTSKGGTTITFTGIHAGDYEIECNACVKKNFDLTVFAKKTRSVTVLSGKQTTVDLDLNKCPFITEKLQPTVFSGNGEKVEMRILLSSFDLSKCYARWYINNKIYNPENEEDSNKFKLQQKLIQINDQEATTYIMGADNGVMYSVSGLYKVFVEIVNKETGDTFRSNTVEVYFTKIELGEGIYPRTMSASFKGESKELDINITPTRSDFMGSITYSKYRTAPYYEYINDVVTLNYDSLPEKVSVVRVGADGPGVKRYDITLASGVPGNTISCSVDIKRTFNFNFPDDSSVTTLSHTDYNYLSINLPQVYQSVNYNSNYDPSEAHVKWYSCDENGNNKVFINQDPELQNLTEYEVPPKFNVDDGSTAYYFICELTYYFDGAEYCTNYPSGMCTKWSKVFTVYYGLH